MNPHYHWLTEGVELLSFFLFSPVLAIVVAYKGWRERADPKRHGMRCAATAAAAIALFFAAKWINADISVPCIFCNGPVS